jgi:hypothetical protein
VLAFLKASFDCHGPYLFFTDPFRILFEEIWILMLNAYSYRELSFPADKLPALAGVAEKLQALTGLTYTDGIFSDDLLTLPRSFFWIVWGRGKRPDIKRSPSWTWAAIDGKLGFMDDCKTPLATLLRINPPQHPEPSSFTTLSLSGRIRTAYSLPPVMTTRNGTRVQYRHPRAMWRRIFDPGLRYAPYSPDKMSIGRAFFDAPGEMPAKFTCVEMFSSSNDSIIILIVAENHADQKKLEYRRIGIGRIWDSAYFDGCSKITFTLV